MLISWFLPAAISDTPVPKMKVQIDKLIATTPKPDYDKEVLVPLRHAQQLAAKEAAKREAEQRQLEHDREVRRAQALAPTTGACADWIAAAGIAEPGIAQTLISHESGCNPSAVNGSSGACGVAQEVPCGKSGCALGNGACQVAWMNGYVLKRYGSWSAAWTFWQRTDPRPYPGHWY